MLPNPRDLQTAVVERFSLRALQVFTLLIVACQAPTVRALSLEQLTVSARTNPLGIVDDDVSFGWAIASEERGVVQGAYQIRVGTRERADDVWNSSRVTSERQVDIRLPADVRLDSATRYHWQVRIWDGTGAASKWSSPVWFETGLLSPAEWSGAKWIARPTPATNASESLPLLRCEVMLTKRVESARVYASAHGLYQLSINGKKVGDQYLAPGWTDYAQRIQTQTYDGYFAQQNSRPGMAERRVSHSDQAWCCSGTFVPLPQQTKS